jgi:hypothetical protein
MKNLIITLIIIVFSLFQMQGFGQEDTVKEKTVYNAIMRSNMIFQTFGEWGVYASFSEKIISDSSSEQSVVTCYVCPTIIFYENLTATLRYNSDQQELYNWNIKSDSLYLEFQGDPAVIPYFGNQKYKMVFTNFDTYTELKLYDTKSSGYTLRKTIKP